MTTTARRAGASRSSTSRRQIPEPERAVTCCMASPPGDFGRRVDLDTPAFLGVTLGKRLLAKVPPGAVATVKGTLLVASLE